MRNNLGLLLLLVGMVSAVDAVSILVIANKPTQTFPQVEKATQPADGPIALLPFPERKVRLFFVATLTLSMAATLVGCWLLLSHPRAASASDDSAQPSPPTAQN